MTFVFSKWTVLVPWKKSTLIIPHLWSIGTLCTLGLGKTSTKCWISSAILVYRRPTLLPNGLLRVWNSPIFPQNSSTKNSSRILLLMGHKLIWKNQLGWWQNCGFLLFPQFFFKYSSWHQLVTQLLKFVGPPSSLSRGFIGRERQNGRARCHGTVVPWPYCERQDEVVIKRGDDEVGMRILSFARGVNSLDVWKIFQVVIKSEHRSI